ncbi:MAG TPA: hypothetical protein VF587_08110 [Solirubrobacteraceae bacterium]|jgi:uncharacterized membrane protein
MSSSLRWAVLVLLSAQAMLLVQWQDLDFALRPALALWFLLACPGLALVPLLGVRDALASLSLVVALSIALDTLVAGALVYAGEWGPTRAIVLLAAVVLSGSLLQSWRVLRSGP